ncbi:MAG TPA: COX15/CtaA family protein [Methylomirabilota bacterium]|nr:COX15/CtaA family protein [Methylomirabilota bacterium]
MTRSTDNPWLHRFAVLTALATWVLIWIGGLVTSHGVGMSVPDWPTTYGYNMFFFPISKWVGGIFYEHTHRLVASGVGLLTVILFVWLALREERRWLRRLGALAVLAVVAQGVLGGLRVTALKDEIGIFHATLAQLFLVMICSIALFTSRWWIQSGDQGRAAAGVAGKGCLVISGLILLQLVIGAVMRHQHAGLAIPDFPTAYGKWWPDMDAEAVSRYNQMRGEVTAVNPITAFQIGLQMVHRILGVIIVGAVVWAAIGVIRCFGGSSLPGRLSTLWLVTLLIQVTLGMATIWTNKSADVATAHVAVGALSLVMGVMLALMVWRLGPTWRTAKDFDGAGARVGVPAPGEARLLA